MIQSASKFAKIYELKDQLNKVRDDIIAFEKQVATERRYLQAKHDQIVDQIMLKWEKL